MFLAQRQSFFLCKRSYLLLRASSSSHQVLGGALLALTLVPQPVSVCCLTRHLTKTK